MGSALHFKAELEGVELTCLFLIRLVGIRGLVIFKAQFTL
jgi:hypothetical protein